MLVSAKDMLEKAREGKYAVGQFNINNLEWTKSGYPGRIRGRRKVYDRI